MRVPVVDTIRESFGWWLLGPNTSTQSPVNLSAVTARVEVEAVRLRCRIALVVTFSH